MKFFLNKYEQIMNALVPQISSMCTCTVPLPGEFAASTPAIEGAEAANCMRTVKRLHRSRYG